MPCSACACACRPHGPWTGYGRAISLEGAVAVNVKGEHLACSASAAPIVARVDTRGVGVLLYLKMYTAFFHGFGVGCASHQCSIYFSRDAHGSRRSASLGTCDMRSRGTCCFTRPRRFAVVPRYGFISKYPDSGEQCASLRKTTTGRGVGFSLFPVCESECVLTRLSQLSSLAPTFYGFSTNRNTHVLPYIAARGCSLTACAPAPRPGPRGLPVRRRAQGQAKTLFGWSTASEADRPRPPFAGRHSSTPAAAGSEGEVVPLEPDGRLELERAPLVREGHLCVWARARVRRPCMRQGRANEPPSAP
jgi:hypothetical protein